MSPFRLATTELRRLASSRLARLGLIALVLIPTLYGGLYLWANHDPYGAFPNVPAAVVSEDVGATLSTGEQMDVGHRVADHLVESKSFDWHLVSRSDAMAGVNDGRFAFAVIVPATFSADLASTADYRPRQATVILETNDANNYMTTMIGNTVIKQVSASVAAEVSQTAESQLLLGFGRVHDQLGKAVDGAAQLGDGLRSADNGAHELARGAGTLATGLDELAAGADRLHDGTTKAASGAADLQAGAKALATGLTTLDRRTATLPQQTRALAGGAAEVAAGNEQVATAASEVAAASTAMQEQATAARAALLSELRAQGLTDAQIALVDSRLATLDAGLTRADARVQAAATDLNRLSAGADQVATGARTLADAMPALHSGIHQAATGAQRLESGATQLASGLTTLDAGAAQLATGATNAAAGADRLSSGANRLAGGLDELTSGASRLHDELARGRDAVPNPTDSQRRAMAETIGNPLRIESGSLSSAGSYGAGLAPMFISLALWIGAYTLFLLVRPLSTRALATSQHSVRTALGGWLPPVALGAAQVVILLATVGLGLDLRIAHPVLALLFVLFVSATFVAILHALAARLGAVGKFLGLVFMVVQLVSAGGTFPWQTLPGPLQAVHHVVPMSYAIDGLRRLMYGADLGPLVGDVAVLAAFLVGALAVSSVAARRARVWTPSRVKPELAL